MNRLLPALSLRLSLMAFSSLLIAGACVATRAQPAPEPTTAPAAPDAAALSPETPPALPVGSATQSLLAFQSIGIAASTTPRPIPGNVATRSYDRYLKSFEYPIPEKFGTTVRGSGSGSGTSTP